MIQWYYQCVFISHLRMCNFCVYVCVCVVSFLIRPQGGGNANWASQSKHTVYNIHMIWHKYIVSINLMTVPHTDGRHYLRQLDLISLCVTIVTASPFVVWFKVCWKNNDILGQCHLMPLETSWNHIATLNCLDYAALCRQEKSEAHGGTPAFAPGPSGPSGPSPCEACEARAVGSAGTAGTGTVGTVELDRFDRFDRLDACRGGVQGVQGGVQGVMAQESHPQTIQHINIYDILQHLYKYNIYKIIGNIILYYIMTITSHVRTIPAKLLGAFLNQTSVRSKDASWLSRISTLIISRPFVERSTLPVRMGCTRCMSFLPLTFAASQCQEWRSYSFSKEFWNFQQFDVFTLAPFGSICLQVTALQHFARPPVRTVASQVRPLTRTIPWLIHAALFLLKAVFSNVYYIFL